MTSVMYYTALYTKSSGCIGIVAGPGSGMMSRMKRSLSHVAGLIWETQQDREFMAGFRRIERSLRAAGVPEQNVDELLSQLDDLAEEIRVVKAKARRM